MFTITKQVEGHKGAFVRLVQVEGDDFAVITRLPNDGKLQHRYIGPDLAKAEEVFQTEASKFTVDL